MLISPIKVFMLFWIVTGIGALVIGTKYIHNPATRQALHEQLKEIAEELKLKEEDCICIMYVGFIFLGFMGALVALFRRFKKYLRRNK